MREPCELIVFFAFVSDQEKNCQLGAVIVSGTLPLPFQYDFDWCCLMIGEQATHRGRCPLETLHTLEGILSAPRNAKQILLGQNLPNYVQNAQQYSLSL